MLWLSLLLFALIASHTGAGGIKGELALINGNATGTRAQFRTMTPSPSPSPSAAPSQAPTAAPTEHPTLEPTGLPTAWPTAQPSTPPTVSPTAQPSTTPPSMPPTTVPTVASGMPSLAPTTAAPSHVPSRAPTMQPTAGPSRWPTLYPTQPTADPSRWPTLHPTQAPSRYPTSNPSFWPTAVPSVDPIFGHRSCMVLRNEEEDDQAFSVDTSRIQLSSILASKGWSDDSCYERFHYLGMPKLVGPPLSALRPSSLINRGSHLAGHVPIVMIGNSHCGMYGPVIDRLAERVPFFNILRTCRCQMPRTRIDLNAPQDASDLSDATL